MDNLSQYTVTVDGEEIEIVLEEEVDTNPDLYKQRTIQALNEQRYYDALYEAETALQYGRNELQYRVLKARVLFEMGDYNSCFNYINESGLWQSKRDENLLYDEQNFINYAYAVCFRECGLSIDDVETIIVTPDGKGMFKTVQEAIPYASGKTLFLTAGDYNDKVCILGKQNIKITCAINNTANFKNSVQIIKSTFEIHNLNLEFSTDIMMIINNSKGRLANLSFKNGGIATYLQNCTEIMIYNCKYLNNDIGVIVCSKNISFIDTKLESNKIAIVCASKNMNDKNKANIKTCQFNKNKVAVLCALNGEIMIDNSSFEKNQEAIVLGLSKFYITGTTATEPIIIDDINIFMPSITIYECVDGDGGIVTIDNSEISHSENTGVCCDIDGLVSLSNSRIIGTRGLGAPGYGIWVKKGGVCRLDNCLLKNNMYATKIEDGAIYRETNSRQLNNDVVGLGVESIKNVFKTFFE